VFAVGCAGIGFVLLGAIAGGVGLQFAEREELFQGAVAGALGGRGVTLQNEQGTDGVVEERGDDAGVGVGWAGGTDHFFDQEARVGIGGLESAVVFADSAVEFLLIFVGENAESRGKAVSGGVGAGGGFAFRRARAGAGLGVSAVGVKLCLCSHRWSEGSAGGCGWAGNVVVWLEVGVVNVSILYMAY
jgi:hypothetical protein